MVWFTTSVLHLNDPFGMVVATDSCPSLRHTLN
jgi:hypothetical protein